MNVLLSFEPYIDDVNNDGDEDDVEEEEDKSSFVKRHVIKSNLARQTKVVNVQAKPFVKGKLQPAFKKESIKD